MRALARFRVDPAKVRVGVRHVAGWRWLVTVAARSGAPHEVKRSGATVLETIDAALDAADAAGMKGVDLGMECSYEHPFGGDERP